MSSPWWASAFQAGYLDLYPHRGLDAARAETRFLVAHGLSGRVLDLCCGWGRHLVALRELGVEACGVDWSADLLERALAQEGGELLRGRVVRGDARDPPFRDRAFDGVVSLFSSFGYFGDEGDRRVLAGVARVLKPGGAAFLDLMNPARVRAALVPYSRRERGGTVLEERRELTDGARRVVKRVRARLPDGSERAWHEDVRMYEAGEVAQLAAAAGLSVEQAWGGFDGAEPGAQAERQVVRLRCARA